MPTLRVGPQGAKQLKGEIMRTKFVAIIGAVALAAGFSVAFAGPASAATCHWSYGHGSSSAWTQDLNGSCGTVAVRIEASPIPGIEHWGLWDYDADFAYRSTSEFLVQSQHAHNV